MAQGLVRYYTGKPCPAGHLGDRFVTSGGCVECVTAFTRGWRSKTNHPDAKPNSRGWHITNGLMFYNSAKPCKRGHIAQRYVSTGQCTACESLWQWGIRHPERMRHLRRIRYHKNPAKERAWNRRWREANMNRVRLKEAEYHKKHPLFRRVKEAVRRARKLSSAGAYTASDIRTLLIRQKQKCVYCLRSIAKGFHVDHFLPLALGGSNDISNIQLLCPSCNMHKSSKDPIIFARQIGLLL